MSVNKDVLENHFPSFTAKKIQTSRLY